MTTPLRTLILAATAFASAAWAAPDPLDPTSDPSTALVSPLRAVTLVTADGRATDRFFGEAVAMTAGADRLSPASAKQLGLGNQARPVRLYRRGTVADAALVRAVVVPGARPARSRHDALAAGGLALGLPIAGGGQATREKLVEAAGFRSAVGPTAMTLPRGDGGEYTVSEIHYQAPDGVLVLGIDRGDMRPVGPVDAATGVGGPAYSSIVATDADATAKLLRDVLGLEARRDFVFTSSGPKGGLGLPAQTRVRFQQWFAPGSRTGYVIVMDLLNTGMPAPPGPTAGLKMWSFETRDLAEVERRARAAGISTTSPSKVIDSPGLGRVRSLVLNTPDGFAVEVYQPLAGAGR